MLQHQDMRPAMTEYRWVMLGLLWLLYACFGLVSRAIAPLVTPMLKDLRISFGQMGIILGSWQLTYILVSIVAGTIIDRRGIRTSLFAGTAVMALSAVLRYFPEGFIGMLLAVALFGVGAPMVSIGCPKTIAVWFDGKSRGTAVGVYMTGSFIGMLFSLTFTNSLAMPLMGYSWRMTFVAYGIIVFGIALLWLLLARDIRSGSAADSAGTRETFSRLLAVRDVRILLLMGLLSFAVLHGFNSWIPKILEMKGSSPAMAGFKAATAIASGIPALLLVPRFVPPRLRSRAVALFSLVTVAALFAVVTTSGSLQVGALVLYGIAVSSYVPVLTLILMDTPEVEPRFMGSAAGLFFCVAEIGGFAGPFVMGILVDLTGAFLAGALLFAALSLLVVALTSFLRQHPTGS